MHDSFRELAIALQDESSRAEVPNLAKRAIENQLRAKPILNAHPLGFFHLQLANLDHLGKLRLHAWLPHRRVTQDPPWMVHRHTHDLRSYVLRGSLWNSVYDVYSNENNPSHQLYGVKYDAQKSILTRLDRPVSCSETCGSEFRAGDIYSVGYTEFHATEVALTEFTVTVALFGSADSNDTLVIGDLDGQNEYAYERRTISADETDSILREILGAF